MAVELENFAISEQGLEGSLRIELASELLTNVSERQWKTHQITVPFNEDSEAGNSGEYRLLFGEDPFLWIGPGGSVYTHHTR